MRHRKSGRKLGRTAKVRMLLLKNLAVSLLLYEEITTTEAKAKELRPIIDKVINKAKQGGLAARRQLLSYFNNNESVVKKLFESMSDRYKDRKSGFTTIVKLSPRVGDNAPMNKISLISE